MRTVRVIAEARAEIDRARSAGAGVGLVPTMGFLHAGHVSLMERAASEADFVVATIFVNPLQFGPAEDLAAYPRDLETDTARCEGAGVDLLLVPGVEEMYPGPMRTAVTVADITARFEGASRPGHFAGVATVVAKLFNIVGPCRAYFGEKDWQQLCVVRQMAADLSFAVEVVGCPTVREPDGLAMSSRNTYLGASDRAAAPVLHRALVAGAESIRSGERSARVVRDVMSEVLGSEPRAEVDYAEVVDAGTLALVDPLAGDLRLLVAARIGPARLIDNVGAVAD
ncbi:MAG: pantoate--beta-alanine ligase [Actinobacteria bacterium]|nr:pantoate--beta-alanine ligase [Actinomycetota bacterium]